MISREEIENLANLARLELDEAQKASLAKDMSNILGYFEELKKAEVGAVESGESSLQNVMRNDEVTNEPKTGGQFIRVKKIL